MKAACFRRLFVPSLVLLLAAPAVARADVVYLRDGREIRGKVVDHGATVEVRREHGSITLPKRLIQRVSFDDGSVLAPRQRDRDALLLATGRWVEGKVEIVEGGARYRVSGPLGEISFTAEEVSTIWWAGSDRPQGGAGQSGGSPPGSGAATPADYRAEVKRLVDASLDSLDDAGADPVQARRRLMDLGLYAVEPLEGRLAGLQGEARRVADDVLFLNRVRMVLPSAVEQTLPQLYDRLGDPQVSARMDALKDAAFLDAAGMVDVLALFAREPAQGPEVRGFAVQQLARLGADRALLELLSEEGDGAVRLAAAVGLGENGIYVGVPVLIDALDLSDRGLRALASERLQAWTGRYFDYDPDDPEAERVKAIGLWRDWWVQSGPALIDNSLKATIQWDRVSSKEKEAARRLWQAGNESWDLALGREGPERDEAVGLAVLYFKQALEEAPTMVQARINLALVLATEKSSDPQAAAEALDQLELVLSRYAPLTDPPLRRLVLYYAGRLHQGRGRFPQALGYFGRAIRLDPDFIEGYLGQAEASFQRALSEDELLEVEERKELLADSRMGALRAREKLDEQILALPRPDFLAPSDRPLERGSFTRAVDAYREGLGELRTQADALLERVGAAEEANR